jgi:hypothetical protein
MATLSTLPTVTRIQVPLRRGEFDVREFHALPSFMLFIEQILPAAGPGVIAARETPRQQMDSLLRKWNAGMRMRQGRAFDIMRPPIDSVWEMKSVDLRIFGWMHKPRCFVAVFGGLADDYKSQNGNSPKESYDKARERVVWIRDRLGLDNPKFVTGDYDALV